MTATNQQMTREQLADLSTLAAQLQAKAEANDDRDTAVMAYAVQRACSELEESRREFRAAGATIHNLELKVEQVVAENAGLKKFPDQIVSFIGKLGSSEIGADTKEKIELAAIRVKTSATDAYLAEVRAQGVDEIAELYSTLAAHEVNKSIADSWRESARFARDHAAQLRQGAKS